MSNKSLLTEFKWQLKKQAYQLGTPSLDIPTGDVAGDAPAGSYGEALSAAAQHRSAMQRELDRYRDRKSTRLNSSHSWSSRMPSSA